ncbi:NUDIX hydrolase domain-like protein [Russula aff. rugulosa BPL654]|nr:NUDIX hydrolase domain-like protein [Russula aff. rugulosa BPL654]
MTTQKSLISVLNVCDNFRPHLSPEPLVPFLLTPKSRPPLGLLRPPVVAALCADNAWRSANGHPLAWDIPTTANSDDTTTTNDDAPSPPPYIAFAPVLASGSPAARTHALAETLDRWRANANKGSGAFAEVIGGSCWRSEWYDVYLAPGGALRTDGRDPLTLVEVPTSSDSASGPVSYALCVRALGVVTHGVHMTVYEQKGGDADGEVPMRVWVPRRAATKPTYPGMLDNSVAGGIAGGTTALDTVVKEAAEEASLDPQLVRKKARSVGAVSYYRQTDAGWLQPEVQFVYDMRVEPGEARLAPMDGEVESFKLMSIDEIVSRMHAGEFKPNCALVLIDFLVRHGYLTPENEPRYLEINQRLHGKFEIERW